MIQLLSTTTGVQTPQERPLSNCILCLQMACRENRCISVLVRRRKLFCWDGSPPRTWLLLCAENTSYKLKIIVITCCYKHLLLISRDSFPQWKEIFHMFWLCMWEVSIWVVLLLSLLAQNSCWSLAVTSLGKNQQRWHSLLISWSQLSCLGSVKLPFARLVVGNNKDVWIVSVSVGSRPENRATFTGHLVCK